MYVRMYVLPLPFFVLSYPRHLPLSSPSRPARRFINLHCNPLIAKFLRRARTQKVAVIKGRRGADRRGSNYRFISTKTCTTLSDRSIHRRWWEIGLFFCENYSASYDEAQTSPSTRESIDFSVRSGLLRSDSKYFWVKSVWILGEIGISDKKVPRITTYRAELDWWIDANAIRDTSP